MPYEAAKGTATTSSVFGYHYTNPAATSAEEADRWLIQYELHASSGTSGFDNYTGTIFDTDYSGFAWLDVPAVLDPTASLHRFTLYSEQVSPFGASGDFDPVTVVRNDGRYPADVHDDYRCHGRQRLSSSFRY